MSLHRFAKTWELLVSLIIAVVWFQSSTAHTGNPYYFLSSIYKYELVEPTAGRWLAIILPSLQFVLAVCLVTRILVGGALLGSALLLTLFVVVQAITWYRGLEIDCGCFGPSYSVPIGQQSLATVGVLALIAYSALACKWIEPISKGDNDIIEPPSRS